MRSPAELKYIFKHWGIVKDFTNQCINIMMNLRQSKHTSSYGSKARTIVVKFFSLSVFTTAI